MTKILVAVVSAALAIGMAGPASAATTDPEVIIYRFNGVRDSGATDSTGITTVFFCTNFSDSTENFRFVTRLDSGAMVGNRLTTIGHLQSTTVATHATVVYPTGINQNTGAVLEGTTAIAATSVNVMCTAVTIDAAGPTPVG